LLVGLKIVLIILIILYDLIIELNLISFSVYVCVMVLIRSDDLIINVKLSESLTRLTFNQDECRECEANALYSS